MASRSPKTKVRLLRDYWISADHRVAKGTIIALPAEEAIRLMNARKAEHVKNGSR